MRGWLLRDGLRLEEMSAQDLHAMTLLYFERELAEVRAHSIAAQRELEPIAAHLSAELWPPSAEEVQEAQAAAGQAAAERMFGGAVK